MFGSAFQSKSVWVSGHTGFKGSWLSLWLLRQGANVHGFSLPPPTSPSLFDQLRIQASMRHEIGDIRDAAAVQRSIEAASPDFVFHLAAQPLVRLSYEFPIETFATNVLGTAHVLNATRALQKPCAVVIVSTDKCYENREQGCSFSEEDRLGGHDPYSASKAASEIVTASYRDSFFQQSPVLISSARAGNVIGGGDWATDRLIPDCVRALSARRPVMVRNPRAVRPWQHVLEPLSGYLRLAQLLASTSSRQLASAFNFGPDAGSRIAVGDVVEMVLQHWPGTSEIESCETAPHEAGLLNLSINKAKRLLKWQPVWDCPTAVEKTMQWYHAALAHPQGCQEFSEAQIAGYEESARDQGIEWGEIS